MADKKDTKVQLQELDANAEDTSAMSAVSTEPKTEHSTNETLDLKESSPTKATGAGPKIKPFTNEAFDLKESSPTKATGARQKIKPFTNEAFDLQESSPTKATGARPKIKHSTNEAFNLKESSPTKATGARPKIKHSSNDTLDLKESSAPTKVTSARPEAEHSTNETFDPTEISPPPKSQYIRYRLLRLKTKLKPPNKATGARPKTKHSMKANFDLKESSPPTKVTSASTKPKAKHTAKETSDLKESSSTTKVAKVWLLRQETDIQQQQQQHQLPPTKVTGASTRPKSKHSTKDLKDSSPSTKKPPKEKTKASRKKKKEKSLLRTIQTRSLSQYSPKKEVQSKPTTQSEIDPLIYDGSANNRVPERQAFKFESVEESRTDYVASCIICYQDNFTKFRNSAYMIMLQLLFYSIPVSSIVMGRLFTGECPKNPYLPILGAAIGVNGLIYFGIWAIARFSNRHPQEPFPKKQKIIFGVFCLVLFGLIITDMVFLGHLSPSFDPTSPEYCNETFYTYTFYKEILTAVYIVLTVLLYLPGCRDALMCVDYTTTMPYRTCNDTGCWSPWIIDD